MIYNQIGNNTASLQYQDDPLAKTIQPDYKKLSMSAWGIPELEDMDKFAPKMDENLDTVPDEYTQYVNNFNDLTSTAQKFMKLGVDITKPSLNPQENAAHMEWLKSYNDNVALGKKLQQSRKIREAVQSAGTKDVFTNQVPDEVLTTTDPYVFRGDLSGLKSLVDSRSRTRDYYYSKEDEKGALDEIQQTLDAIDTWELQQTNNNPAFAPQVKAQAELARAQIKGARYDKYKNDLVGLKQQALNDTKAYRDAQLAIQRDALVLRQNQSTGVPFETESLIRNAGMGDQQSIDLINEFYGKDTKGVLNGASINVVNGSDIINGNIEYKDGDNVKTIKTTKLKNKDGSIHEVKETGKYFVRFDENGNRYITPVNETTIRSMSQGIIGKVTEAGVSKNKTSNLWSEEETEISDVPINSKNKSGSSITIKTNNTNSTKKKVTW